MVKILGSYPLSIKTQLSTMLLQSTLLRPTPKIANYKSYWVCISARRGFSASPPGVRGPNSNYMKHITTKKKIQTLATPNHQVQVEPHASGGLLTKPSLDHIGRTPHDAQNSCMINQWLIDTKHSRGLWADSGSRTHIFANRLCARPLFATQYLKNTSLFCRC